MDQLKASRVSFIGGIVSKNDLSATLTTFILCVFGALDVGLTPVQVDIIHVHTALFHQHRYSLTTSACFNSICFRLVQHQCQITALPMSACLTTSRSHMTNDVTF